VGNAESDLLRERDRRTGLAVLLLVLGLHLLVLVLLPNQVTIPASRARSNRPVVVWLSPRRVHPGKARFLQMDSQTGRTDRAVMELFCPFRPAPDPAAMRRSPSSAPR